MMPPAARMGRAPSGGTGMPSATWARPLAEKVRAPSPTMMRLVAAESPGVRRSRRPRPSSTRGTA